MHRIEVIEVHAVHIADRFQGTHTAHIYIDYVANNTGLVCSFNISALTLQQSN